MTIERKIRAFCATHSVDTILAAPDVMRELEEGPLFMVLADDVRRTPAGTKLEECHALRPGCVLFLSHSGARLGMTERDA